MRCYPVAAHGQKGYLAHSQGIRDVSGTITTIAYPVVGRRSTLVNEIFVRFYDAANRGLVTISCYSEPVASMLDDQEFRLKSDETLSSLHNALVELSDRYEFETDYGGALTVEFEDPPAKFVVSPNAPVRQIWVSAHMKSYKLEWDAGREAFVLPETGQ